MSRARPLVLVVALRLGIVAISAHEAGVGRAVVTFPSRNEYGVELTVDAGSLLSRLEVLAGQPRSETLSAPEYAARIAALQQVFMRHVRVRFDATDGEARFESVREAAAADPSMAAALAPEVIIRMRGGIPTGAKAMTWSYDLTYASYALTVKAGGSESAEWLEGGQESRPFSLNHSNHAGRILPRTVAKTLDYLPFALIVVAGLFPFSRRPAGTEI